MGTEKLTANEAFTKMAVLCSKSERCSPDIKKRLLEHGFEKYDAEAIIDRLKKEEFIDDERYARAFVRDKFRINKWGRVKIIYYLKQKGLPQKYIRAGLEEINEEKYVNLLLKTMKNKAKSIKSNNRFDKMGKIIRFMQNRGFEPEYIHRHINSVIK